MHLTRNTDRGSVYEYRHCRPLSLTYTSLNSLGALGIKCNPATSQNYKHETLNITCTDRQSDLLCCRCIFKEDDYFFPDDAGSAYMQPRSHAVLPAVVRHNAQSQSYGDNIASLPAIISWSSQLIPKDMVLVMCKRLQGWSASSLPPSQQPG